MSYYVIGDQETVIGFRLAGVQGRIARTPFEAVEALKAAVSTEGVSVVVINERLATAIRGELARYDFMDLPLIIGIPDRSGPLEGRKSMREIVKSAVGVAL